MILALPQVPVHHLYRAMDFLLAAEDEVRRTSTYFEVEQEDAEVDDRPG